MPDEANITRLLRDIENGRSGAMDNLMESVYTDLERMARSYMNQRFGPGLPGLTLEPAALVHESYLKLIRQRERFDNRGHFFAIATKVMLRVLLDYDRRRRASKRGGAQERITLLVDHPDPRSLSGTDPGIEVECLVSALERLEAQNERKADVVKLRVVWGLTLPEIAASLGLSLATIERDWAFSKAWLAREAESGVEPPRGS